MNTEFPYDKSLILFDGVCNLCNRSIQYVIKHDKYDQFRFAALQSEIGMELMALNKIETTEMDSILLFTEKDSYSYKSTAALKIASKLGFPINLMGLFFLLPSFIRNWVYDFIAKHRYKWFGKREECMIPTPELRAKFLD